MVVDEYGIVQDIVNESRSYFSEETLKAISSFSELNQLANQMNSWLKEVEEKDVRYQVLKTEIKKEEDLWKIGNKSLPTIATEKIKNRVFDHNDEVLALMKWGYLLIHSFREALTGQEITYRIAVNEIDKNTGEETVQELSLSMWDVLSMSKVRTGKTENDVSLYINNSIKRIAKDKATYSNSLDEHQLNLYYAIEYMYTDQKLIPPGKGKLKPISDKPNRGRVYEVYTKYKNKFTPPLTIKEQFRIYNSLKKAKGENISQLKQGDSELTQLKAVFNTSTAQLVPLSELKNFMKDTLKALTEGKTDREKIEKLLSTYTTIGMEEGSKRVLNDALDYVQENFLDKLSGNENLTNIEIVV